MTTSEKIDQLNEAIQLVEDAQGLVNEIMESNEAYYNAYGKFGFDQLLGNGNPNDSSLYTIADDLAKDDQEGKE